MLGWAGHSALEGGEVGGDAIDVKVNKGLLVFFGEEEGAVGGVAHEYVFGEGRMRRGAYSLSMSGFFSTVHPSRRERPQSGPWKNFAASVSPLSRHSSHARAGIVNSPP